jgi:hypothetical protein
MAHHAAHNVHDVIIAQHTQRIREAAREGLLGVCAAQPRPTEARSILRAGGQVELAEAAA